MGSPCIWNLNLIYSIVSLAAAAAQPDLLYHVCNDTYGNYTSNSTYSENLNTLLSDITSNTRTDYGFYNLSSGQGSNEVHGIGLCRGDLNLSTCHSCLNDSSYKLRENCPNQREAIGWYNNCMLRYSHRSIFGVMEEAPAYKLLNAHSVGSAFQFSSTLGSLLSRLGDKSSAGDSQLKYATGSANFTDSEFEYETETESTVHALVQCTPDLSQIDCSKCINDSRNDLLEGSRVPRGGRFLASSCIFRYEMYPFAYEQDNTSAPSSPPPSPSPSSPPSSSPAATTTATGKGSRRKGSKGKGSNRTKIATILTVITSVVFISIVVLVLCCVRRRRKKETLMKDENDDEIRRIESLEYNLNTIRAATKNFSDEKKLGRGGFGVVHQGTLSNGQEIAVKRLAKNSGQGEVEFKNEVLLVAKLQHRNLIKFLGFCLEEEEKLLIYELVKNRSLDYFLFDAERRALLDWKKRYKIIDSVTRGMIYLHEDSRLRIIHRDLKASNILLDS